MIKIFFLLLSFLSIAAHAAEDSQSVTENSLTAGNSFALRLDFGASDTEAVASLPENTESNKPQPKDNHLTALVLNGDIGENISGIIDRMYCCADPDNLEYDYYNGGGIDPVDEMLSGIFWDIPAEEVVALIDRLQQAPDQGDPNGQFFLGWLYENGVGGDHRSPVIIPVDKTKAAYWYRKLAELGYPEAQYRLGYMTEKDTRNAYWYHKAAEQGHYLAMHAVATAYETGNGIPADFAKAIEWYRKVAETGNAEVAYELGMMYANGDRVPEDDAEAVRWFRWAIQVGCDQEASHLQLGLMYANGEGVSQDKVKAVRLYRFAAYGDNDMAQYQLGLAYYRGDGVPIDYIEAYAWVSVGTSENYPQKNGEITIDKIAEKLTEDDLQKAKDLTEQYHIEATIVREC